MAPLERHPFGRNPNLLPFFFYPFFPSASSPSPPLTKSQVWHSQFSLSQPAPYPPHPPFLILSSSSMCVCVPQSLPFSSPFSLSLSPQALIAWASPGPSPPPPLSPSLPPLERPREKRDSSSPFPSIPRAGLSISHSVLRRSTWRTWIVPRRRNKWRKGKKEGGGTP